jgi:acyl carrier protein
MTMTAIASALQEEIHRIAPDIEVDSIDRDADLREEFDMDSMDFLHLVTALGKRFNLKILEADYPRMRSYNDLCSYLDEKTA